VTASTVQEVIQPDGAKLRVWSAGSGRPVLFLHGFEGHPGEPQFLADLAATRRVVAPEHPGFDGSDDFHGVEDVVDLALVYRRLIEDLRAGPVDLVGHSLGAMFAAEVAALSPHLVRRLVLVSPFGFWLDSAPIPDLFVMTPGELVRALWVTPPPRDNGAKAPDIEQTVRRFRNFGAASRFLWPIPDRGLKKRAQYIHAPTLALFGAEDRLIGPAYGEAFRSNIPDCAVEVVPNAGHMLPFEQPGEFVARVNRFLGAGGAEPSR
jgi:pimeloyl-ACP methyl ester carboxylesterase